MDKKEVVVLYTAFWWTCPNCGHEGFVKPPPVELNPDEQQELRMIHGIEDAVTGDFTAMPETVYCGECEHEYDVFLDDGETV